MFSKRRPPGKTEDDYDQADDYVEMTEADAAPEVEDPAWETAANPEAYDAEDEFEGLGQANARRKSSSLASLLPMAAAAVVGVVGLGLVYVNFIAPSAPTGNEPAVVAEGEALMPADATAEPQLPGLGNEDTASVTPDGALVLAPVSPEPVTTEETAQPEPAAPAEPALTSSLTGAEVTETTTTAPAEPVAGTEPEVAPSVAVKAEEPAAVPAATTAAPPAAEKVATEPKVDVAAIATADLGVRLDALEKRLDQVSAAADKAPAAEQSAIQALDQDIRALKGDLEKISSRLTALEKRPVAVAAPKAETAAPSVTPAPVVQVPPTEPKKPVAATATAKPAAPAVQPVWTLRAAQPGEAWVSEGQSKELRKVSVGDTLSGVGKIQQIRQVGGRWEIVGSQATIRQ